MLQASGAGTAYIRGGSQRMGGVRIARLPLASATLVVLLGVAVVLALGFARQYDNEHHLSEARTPVSAVVTGCRGLASGTGITVVGYRCTADFALDGRAHRDQVDGMRRLLPTGTVIQARTDPRRPSTLVAGPVRSATWWLRATWAAGTAAGILLILLAASWRRIWSGSKRQGVSTNSTPSATVGEPAPPLTADQSVAPASASKATTSDTVPSAAGQIGH